MKEKESRLIKFDEPAHGASGDIGFTTKASNINGLRAVEQQYLHENQMSALDSRAFQRWSTLFLFKCTLLWTVSGASLFPAHSHIHRRWYVLLPFIKRDYRDKSTKHQG